MAFEVNDYLDLIRLLQEHPEWRAELRRLLLTEELLALPELVRDLIHAQRRTEERVSRMEGELIKLAEAQRRTEEEVRALAEAQRRIEQQVEALTQQVQALGRVLAAGGLSGDSDGGEGAGDVGRGGGDPPAPRGGLAGWERLFLGRGPGGVDEKRLRS
ncbi:hypothetical protein HRbin10_02106 [bacterium HR10]|nr:hypothetical protein HRbin10_02106 [bacterium HR10]